MRLVLDTNAYFALLSGEQQQLQLPETADWVGMPSVVIGELLAGFLRGSKAEINIMLLDDFLSSGNIETLVQGRAAAERYGALKKALRERGTPIPTNDIWIAAVALASDARLVSRDLHFGKVPLLVVMGWQAYFRIARRRRKTMPTSMASRTRERLDRGRPSGRIKPFKVLPPWQDLDAATDGPRRLSQV